MKQKQAVLSTWDIAQKCTRMAYQILEHNTNVEELYLLGIRDRGYVFAKQLQNTLQSIVDFPVHLHAITLDKEVPEKKAIEVGFDVAQLSDKTIILIDDVGNSGRTLFYALRTLMTASPRSVQTAVLVDRTHKRFPIHCDYVGLRLNTTANEHITVETNEEDQATLAYLT